MRIVILGAPGSGKRTQTDLLANEFGLSPVMTGELVKRAVSERSALGLEIKELQDAGRVVTEDLILALLRERLLKSELKGGFVLDGFPRNLLQALTLDELMVEINQPLDLILLIDIETDNLMERLVGRRTCRSCGLLYNIYRNPTVVDGVCDACGGRLHQRSDDNEETVSSRIHVFEHLISPLITHYEKQGKLVRIDGNGDVDQVFSLICQAIEEGAPEAPVEAVNENRTAVAEGPAEVESETIAPAQAVIQPAKSEPAETPVEEAGNPSARAASDSSLKKKTAAKKSTKKTITKSGSRKTTKKKASVEKASKKKTIPNKVSKKKRVAKKPVKKRATAKKVTQKKTTKKKIIKKKATTRQVIKKKAKSPSRSSTKKVTKQARKKTAKTKNTGVKRSGSSAVKARSGKSKASRGSSKSAATRKPARKVVKKKAAAKRVAKKPVQKKRAAKKSAKKAVQKKRAAKKSAKKAVQKKRAPSKPVIKKRAQSKTSPKRAKPKRNKGGRK
ncbi:MAG: nucleoside monophosphate kinase [Candidatus Thiodiazotropha sp.]